MVNKKWLSLQPGDTVDIIAPAARQDKAIFKKIKQLLESWQLNCHIPKNIFGKDLLCANSDVHRFRQLQAALFNPHSKAVWCLRGGYGSSRLIPLLSKFKPPAQAKLFIGLSDITALHLFLQQKWQWSTLHGPSIYQCANNEIIPASIQKTKDIILGQRKIVEFDNLTPFNKSAQKKLTIRAPIIGGNLSLVQVSLGTHWQPNTRNKILFLEEVNERGYQVDRMLEHLKQASVFSHIKALLLGDFIGGNDPDGHSRVNAVLKRFAEQNNFPVLQCKGIGHGKVNNPLPLGTLSTLELGKSCYLHVNTGFSKKL